MTIEVQCTSCHTRYRIDEAVLPDGTPTFKCSRCGHVFNFEPRGAKRVEVEIEPGSQRPEPSALNAELRSSRPGAVKRFSADTGAEIQPTTAELAMRRPEPPPQVPPAPRISSAPRPKPLQASPAPRPPVSSVNSAPAAAPSSPSPIRPVATPPVPDEAEDDPLLRPLQRNPPTGELDEGENLAFNFDRESDEREGFEHGDDGDAQIHRELRDDSGGWEVGDVDAVPDEDDFVPPPPPLPRERRRQRIAVPRFATPRGSKTLNEDEQEEVLEAEFPDESGAPVYNRRVTRSSRFFIGLFVLVIAGYAVMTLLIHSSPAVASDLLSRLPMVGDRFASPLTPARMVALRDVHSGYIRTRDGHTALMISGNAQNVSDSSLHTIQIDVSLRGAGRRGLASGAIYCGGDTLSPSMVAKMTPHELAFFQKLSPPKTFILEPSSSSPFVIVFIDPPAAVNAFDLSVAAAVPAEAAAPDSSSASGV